jgi:hypothetical protein
MLKRAILLIGLLFTHAVFGHELNNNINFYTSGFITTTVFGDRDWHEDSTKAAINLDMFSNNLALRTQIAVPSDVNVRRLAIEYSLWLGQQRDLTIQVGRLPRLGSFSNTAVDNPSTADTAIMPLAQYNRRMVNSLTFNSVDGIKAIYTNNTEYGLIKANFDYGKMLIEDQCEIQKEATKQNCRDGFRIDGQDGNYDYGLTYEIGNWTLLGYNGFVRARTQLLDPRDRASVFFTNGADRFEYSITKYGVKYSKDRLTLQTELTDTHLFIAKKNKDFLLNQKSNNWYVSGNYYLTDALSVNGSFSRGTSNMGGNNIDRSIGFSYTYNDITFSIEQHMGKGRAWKKYLANTDNWNTFASSLTYRF